MLDIAAKSGIDGSQLLGVRHGGQRPTLEYDGLEVFGAHHGPYAVALGLVGAATDNVGVAHLVLAGGSNGGHINVSAVLVFEDVGGLADGFAPVWCGVKKRHGAIVNQQPFGVTGCAMHDDGVVATHLERYGPAPFGAGFADAVGEGGFGGDDIAHQASGRVASHDAIVENQQIVGAERIDTGAGFFEQVVGAHQPTTGIDAIEIGVGVFDPRGLRGHVYVQHCTVVAVRHCRLHSVIDKGGLLGRFGALGFGWGQGVIICGQPDPGEWTAFFDFAH